jgi:ribose transport system permease protein
MVSWAGIATVSLFQAGFGTVPIFAVVLVSCLIIGSVSGVLVAWFNVPSFIATLAMGTILGGLTFWASDGATLFGGMPDGFRNLARGSALGLPVLTWWMIAAGAAVWLLLDRIEYGRHLYAIGGNREAALLAGVPVRRDSVVAFALCAAFAGLVGLLLTARLGSAHPTGGGGFLLQAYAAVFLGMTAFKDGEPNVPGTLVGAAIIAVVANGLTILGVPSFLQDVLTGAIIIAAVLLRRAAGRGGSH